MSKRSTVASFLSVLASASLAWAQQKPITGSGAPSGPHFNLNVIGVPRGKQADMTGGNRIFVQLQGACQIRLAAGDFAVTDGNCTDGQAAFQLPAADVADTGVTSYSVYARALGKPGGRSTAAPCATDPSTGETYCSLNATVQFRGKGKSSFTNVSRDLLYIYADVENTGTLQRVPLFDPRLEGYYWQYDNNGMRLVQLRFYQLPTAAQ